MSRTFSLPTFDQLSEPDSQPFKTATTNHHICLPSDDFVISRDKYGTIISRFVDMTWDLHPYAQATRSYTSINFSNRINALNSELNKQHRFILLLAMHPPQGFSNNVSVSTIVFRHSTLGKAAQHALIHDISLFEIFSDHEWFTSFSLTLSKRRKEDLYALGRWLYKFGNILPFTPIRPPDKISKRKYRNVYYQTPVIPQRIYTNILEALERKTVEFESRWSSIRSFLAKRQEQPGFATSRKRSRQADGGPSNFEIEANAHDLQD